MPSRRWKKGRSTNCLLTLLLLVLPDRGHGVLNMYENEELYARFLER
jgi:hypothetical protein